MPDYLKDPILLQQKARSPFVFLERGHLKVEDHCLLLVQETAETEIPVGAVSCIMIEPGVTVTHEAVKLAAEHGTLLVWVGEAGVRVYSAGEPGGKHAQRMLHQARMYFDESARMKAARRLYRLMFDEEMPETRSIDKLRGIEGAKVKVLYHKIAEEYGVEWKGRARSATALQDAIGFAASCLYGLCEAVILSAGFSPAIGIVHSGDARSLVYDLADTINFKSVIPLAFSTYSESDIDTGNRVRRSCRDFFREQNIAELLFHNLYVVEGIDVDSYSTK